MGCLEYELDDLSNLLVMLQDALKKNKRKK